MIKDVNEKDTVNRFQWEQGKQLPVGNYTISSNGISIQMA